MHKELSEKFNCAEQKFMEALDCVFAEGLFSKSVNYQELGGLVDMAKDMMEAKKDCWKAKYYEKMVERLEKEMEDEKRYGDMRPAGYDNYRYMSSGRFASKGHGTRTSGYIPEMMEEDEWMEARVGNPNHSSRYGEAYDRYQDSRRHYTETKSPEDMEHMHRDAKEHLDNFKTSFKEIWKNTSDPNVKKQLKADLSSMIGELTV